MVVALPNREAPGTLLRVVRAGRPVLADKPCARTAAEFLPVLSALGGLTSVELRMATTQVGMRDPSHWLFRHEVAGGGILSWLDLLRYLTGEEVEDVAGLGMRLSGGAVASLYAGYLLAGGRPGYIAPGYDQAIILRGAEGAVSYRAEGSTHVVSLVSQAAAFAASPR